MAEIDTAKNQKKKKRWGMRTNPIQYIDGLIKPNILIRY